MLDALSTHINVPESSVTTVLVRLSHLLLWLNAAVKWLHCSVHTHTQHVIAEGKSASW